MALVDSAETVTKEQAEEYRQALEVALSNSIKKRQNVGQFILHCDLHEAACDLEINRLKALQRQYSRARERIEDFVIRTVLTIGTDDKGKLKVLEGETVKLIVKATPDAVVVDNESSVPSEFQTVNVTMPANIWQALIDDLGAGTIGAIAGEVKETRTPSKSAIRNAIKAGRQVPGASLRGGYRLEVK
jgi:hypothetical protein